MGLLNKIFGGTEWYQSGGVGFAGGTRVKIIGGYDNSSRFKSRIGIVVGLTKDKCSVWAGMRYQLQQLFIIDLGGMRVRVCGDDLELMEEPGRPKDDGQHWQ